MIQANNHNLKVGDKVEITFTKDVDYVDCTTIWQIVRIEEKRFYYQSASNINGAIIGKAWSLFNRKSVKFNIL